MYQQSSLESNMNMQILVLRNKCANLQNDIDELKKKRGCWFSW